MKMTNKSSLRRREPLDASGTNTSLRSVRLETLDSKYCTLSHLQANKDVEKNGSIHQHTLSPKTRLIKRPYPGSCEIKCTLAATDSWATDIPKKQGRIQASAVTRPQASKKLEEEIKQYPVVSRCNLANIFRIPAGLQNARCILSLELQRKSIRCFNTDCIDQQRVELPVSRMNASQDQHVYPDSSASSSDVTYSRSVVNLAGPRETHFKHSTTGINDYENHIKKGLNLSNGKKTLFTQVPRSLNDSDMMQVASSTHVSAVCDLESGASAPSFPKMVLVNLSDTQSSNPSTCDNKNRVQKNSCTGNIVIMEVEENKVSVGQGRKSCPDGDRESDGENAEFFSCQRTTPYTARVVCSRTCITWPFQKLGSSQKNSVQWNIHESVSRSSMYTKCEDDASAGSATNSYAADSRKGANATITHDTAGDISVGDQHPTFTEQEQRFQAKKAESFTSHKESTAMAPPILLLHSKQKTKVDPTVSRALVNIPGNVNQEKSTDVLAENSELQLTKSIQKQKPSMNILKNFEKEHLGVTVGGVSESCKLLDFSENALDFSGLSHCGRSTDLKPKWESEQFSFPKVSKVYARLTLDDDDNDNNSNLSSEEDLVDDICPASGVIMCEIRDIPTDSPQELSDPAFDSTGDEASGGKIDLVMAYEQDALVLDVIQDDPELFGNISEETTEKENKKPLQLSVRKSGGAKHPLGIRTNPRIKWDVKESFTEHTDLGLPDQKYKAQGSISSAPKGDDGDPSLRNDRPSNGTVDNEFDTKYGLFTQKSKGDTTLNRSIEWLWPNFVTSDQRKSEVNSKYLSQPAVHSSEGCFNNDNRCDAEQEEEQDSRVQQVAARALGSFGDPVDRKAYCRYYFSLYHTCFRKACWYLHVPSNGDEKFCMDAVQNFIRSMKSSHLERAVAVFLGYYQKCQPGIHFKLEELKFLLSVLFSRGFVKDLVNILRVLTLHRILPPPEFILSLFEYLAQGGFHVTAADLIDVMSLCVDAGLAFTVDQFVHMQHCLESLKIPREHMYIFQVVKHRALKSGVFNVKADLIFAEVMRCKEQEDWVALGQAFRKLCLSSCSLPELQHLSSIVVEALLKEQATTLLPFSPFTYAVFQGSAANGLIKNLLGRIGISLMFEYYKSQQWKKGRMLLDVLNKLKVSYSRLKALFGSEQTASRCQIVNVAVELFLNSGSVEGAFEILKDDEWITSTSLWPCEPGDLQNRQAILCRLANSAALRGTREALEVLTNLPCLQYPADTIDASQSSKIFNQHLKSCIEKQSLTVAFSTINFMMMMNISVHPSLLRTLIHKLGKQNIWRKARLLYKHATSLGFYPVLQINQYCKLLPIPHSLTEIEMTVAIEMFMVTNASDICDQTQALQVVLKRKADEEPISEKDYHAARSRLLSVSQMTKPKLVIKYSTVNLAQEYVFTLEPLSASKWLNHNIKWTAEIWEQPSPNPSSSDCPPC